jgi:hypothetical protein
MISWEAQALNMIKVNENYSEWNGIAVRRKVEQVWCKMKRGLSSMATQCDFNANGDEFGVLQKQRKIYTVVLCLATYVGCPAKQKAQSCRKKKTGSSFKMISTFLA